MITEALEAVMAGVTLNEADMEAVIEEIMGGAAGPAPTAGLLCALAMRGETVEELSGAARAMRAKVTPLRTPEGPLLDTCGTGGDGLGTINISTATAFVVAAAGVTVAKHGNRSVSSRSGSADVLQALGVGIDAEIEVVERCLAELGLGFLFAPRFHPAMRHAAPIRKAIGVRTLFNLVGPLTNPAFATRQVMGVYDRRRLEDLAQVLGRLGVERAWVVHGEDGLDELTLTGKTMVSEWRDGSVGSFEIHPGDGGLELCDPEALRGGDAAYNAKVLRGILDGEPGPARDVTLWNASAALIVAEKAGSLREGVELAKETIDSGAAAAMLQGLIKLTTVA